MDMQKAEEVVEKALTPERFAHTLRVRREAENLASIYGVDQGRIALAAIFHDYQKDRPVEEQKQIIRNSNPEEDVLSYHHELWHGPAASILIETEFGIDDPDVKSAIRYHTTGKANMSAFDMVLFIADYIEPQRSFPGVDNVRKLAPDRLEEAVYTALKQTVGHLVHKDAAVYPATIQGYNHYNQKIIGGF